jgi:predicted secreted acid phosphatase
MKKIKTKIKIKMLLVTLKKKMNKTKEAMTVHRMKPLKMPHQMKKKWMGKKRKKSQKSEKTNAILKFYSKMISIDFTQENQF